MSVPAVSARSLYPLLGMSFFVTTFAVDATLKLPFEFLLKEQLHLKPQMMAGFFALAGLAWYFKPLAGVMSDAVPLFGTRRRSYLLLSSLLAGVFWLLLAVVPKRYAPLLGVDILINAMIVIASSATGGLLVEQGQSSGMTGRLSSLRNVTYTGAGLVGTPVAGYLGHSFGWTCSLAAACLFLMSLAVLWWLHEPRQPQTAGPSHGDAWQVLVAQWRILRRSRAMWLAALFQFFFFVAPGFLTPLFYYQTDRLHFQGSFLGVLGIANGAAGVVASLLYAVLCRRFSMRVLLIAAIIVGAVAPLGYLHYQTQAQAWVVETCYGFGLGLGTVVTFDMAARAAPRGSEALAYSLLMSAGNIASQLSDVFGSWLNGACHIPFVHLVPINAVSTLLTLCLIPMLPRSLLERHDADIASS